MNKIGEVQRRWTLIEVSENVVVGLFEDRFEVVVREVVERTVVVSGAKFAGVGAIFAIVNRFVVGAVDEIDRLVVVTRLGVGWHWDNARVKTLGSVESASGNRNFLSSEDRADKFRVRDTTSLGIFAEEKVFFDEGGIRWIDFVTGSHLTGAFDGG